MTYTDYRNFDLLITRAGDRYRAFVVDAPAGEASVLFDLPFAADELTGLGGLVRGVRRHIGAADEPEPAGSSSPDLTGLGQRLFAAIFQDKVQTLLAASLSSVAQEGAGLRLRLRFEEDAAGLATLPWETLYDPVQAHFIGLGEASPILRYLSLPRSRSALLVEPPLRVLALLSSPAGLAPLDMEREWRTIQDALASLVADGKFVLERLASPTLDALQQRLLGEPVHILHFVGHGVFDEASQAGSLALEDARGRPHLVRGEQLAALLRNHPAMRLAYLNACEGALASGGSVFTGVAQTLVHEGVPAAVAMQAEITDTGAIELARTFYAALAAGRPVDAALTQARVALSASGSPEWAIPVLFSRSPDNRLFDIRGVLPTPDCPYPGMVPFSEAQREFFFGRDKEIEEGVERLRQHPFLTIVGPSGSGKSSLIYAGVIPALRKSRRFGPGEWAVQVMRPGQHPLAALAERLGSSPETLSSLTLTERTLLFVDQFEEVFTLAAAGEAQAFLDALQSLIGRPNLHILLTVRADFYPELMACTLWQPIRANRLELTPLGDDELWAAIVEPANRVGVSVDEALAVQLIADAAGQSGVLPLVQEALVLLWARVERRELKLAAYRAMAEGGRSGLQVAIDRRASIVYENLPGAAQAIARRIFLRLIQFGEGRADTRRQQTVAELRASGDDPALFDQTLAVLTTSRLLTTSGDAGGGSRRVDIAHEALIAGWPRLQEWLNQRRTAEQSRRRLETKAAEWMAAEQRGGLLDAYELQEAESWLAGEDARELGYSPVLVDLVKASKDALTLAETEKEAQRQRELAQANKLAEAQRQRAEEGEKAARSLRTRLILATAAVGIAVLAALAAAWFGVDAGKQRTTAQAASTVAVDERNKAATAAAAATVAQGQAVLEARNAVEARETAEANAMEARQQQRVAEEQTRIARYRQLAIHSGNTLRENQYELSLLLALEAGCTSGRWEACSAIRSAMDHPVYSQRVLYEPTGAVLEAKWNKDETRILTRSESGAARVWDVISGEALFRLGDTAVAVLQAVWSPDGTHILTRAQDGAATIWNAQTGDEQLLLESVGARVSDAMWSQDSARVLTQGDDGAARIWDAVTGEGVHRLQGHTGEIVQATWSKDGMRLLIQSSDSTARIWDTATGKELLRLEGVDQTTWSSDESRILSASADGIARIWDAISGDELLRLEGHTDAVLAAHWNENQSLILTASADKTAIIWDAGSGDELLRLGDHTDPVRQATWSPSGFYALTLSGETVRVWDAESGEMKLRLRDVNEAMWIGVNRFLTYGDDGVVRIWEGAFLEEMFEGHTGPILSAQWSENESSFLTASTDKTARVWSDVALEDLPRIAVSSVRKLVDETGETFYGGFVAWSKNGTRILVTDCAQMDNYGYCGNDIILFRDAASGDELSPQFEGNWGSVVEAAWNQDESLLLARIAPEIPGLQGYVNIWDGISGQLVRKLETGTGPFRAASWSKDGTRILTASCVRMDDLSCTRSAAVIWDVKSGQELRRFEEQTGSLRDASWKPDESRILTFSCEHPIQSGLCAQGHARIWNVANGQVLLDLIGLSGILWSHDGTRLLALRPDHTVQMLNADNGNVLRIFKGHSDTISTAEWTRDDSRILTAGADGTARVWDAAHGTELLRLEGHNGPILEAKWSQDESLILTIGLDDMARLWDAMSGGTLLQFEDVASAAWNPDGSRLITTSRYRGGVRVWYTRPVELVKAACRYVPRNMTLDEWNLFVGNAYRPTCTAAPIPPDAIGAIADEVKAMVTKGEMPAAANRLGQLIGWLEENGQFSTFGIKQAAWLKSLQTGANPWATAPPSP